MSLEDDRKLVQAVKDYRPPNTLHPIANQAWDLYEAGGNAWSPASQLRIREILDGQRADLKALGEAIFGLARFMIYVTENLGDQATGDQIAELIREYGKLYEPFWEKVGEALANLGGESAATFQAFTGTTDPAIKKTAPLVGQGAPEGSIKLGNIAPPLRPPPPSRPPPWAKKK